MTRLTRTLLWLCSIPSPTGEEKALCDAIEARLAGHADVQRIGDSLIAKIPGRPGGRRVALVGHLDVVRTEHDGAPRIEGDRLYGPGAADMKSGLAAMLELLDNGGAASSGVDLTLVFYAREEGPFADNELGIVLDRAPDLAHVDLAVCLEPSDNKLQLGATGSLHAQVTFVGRTAHSARPWQGENAIQKAGLFLTELAALAPREVVIDGLLYRTVTNVTLAEGGRGRNIVPDRFQMNLNHRFAPDTSLEGAQREVEELVGGRAEVKFTDLSPSAPPFAEHPLVIALRDSGVTAVEPKQAWTDVARFAALGVPAVNFGPGEQAQAHQRNEWTSLAKLETGVAILMRWLSGAR
ncbi:MAG TPA: succinyl-diaminopimelate desuccinylase [Polyangiaceae bacterium]